jgi:hypothetical protein
METIVKRNGPNHARQRMARIARLLSSARLVAAIAEMGTLGCVHEFSLNLCEGSHRTQQAAPATERWQATALQIAPRVS